MNENVQNIAGIIYETARASTCCLMMIAADDVKKAWTK